MIPETNLQNIPRESKIKKLIIPRPGFKFLEADLSQAEARVVAWKAGERRLIEKYERGEDVHSFVATMMFGYLVRKGMRERQTAKPVSHGSNYGLGPRKMTDVILKELDMEVEEKETKKWQARYYQSFPGIKDSYQFGIREELGKNNRVIVNPFGRRRKFYEPWGDGLFRQAYAHYAQSTVADVTNKAMIQAKRLERFGVILAAQVHDSLLFEVPASTFADGDAFHTLAEKVREVMKVPFKINGLEVIVPSELKWGTNWGEMQEVV